jgi:autotransporter-associated beta strand protein
MRGWVRNARAGGVIWFFGAAMACLPEMATAQAWDGYAGNAQHTALSVVASQPLDAVRWDTPVDLNPRFSGSDLLIHYGSPEITAQNTVIVPVKTGASGGFELQAFNGSNGTPLWTQSTDYTLPPTGQGASYSWTPSYSGTLAGGNTLYYPGNGGTVYERGSLNNAGSVTPTQETFYGSLSTYEANAAAYNAGVAISTPITADAAGDIYFGYQTSNSAPGGLTNGIARISASGVGSFFEASQLKVGGVSAGMTQVATNSAPAVTPDGNTVYVAMSDGNFGTGRLVSLNTSTMTPSASVALVDPKTGGGALVPNDGTASPMIGPDGDVYMGVFDDADTSRGWMEHYSANLSVTKPAGGFGWDDTASIVPATMVPSYHGTSSYLIMTKYNNYADPGTGGNGQNMIAILDPNATATDTRFNSKGAGGATIMRVVESILGPTPDANFDGKFPGAVHEWCINTAAVDPATDSVLVNSEDGSLYRWNLATDTLTQQISITAGLGEAYTPTEIGPDGTVYAINNATLFAVGAPTASPAVYATWASSASGSWSNGTDWSVNSPGNAGDTASFSIGNTAATTVTLDGNRSVGTLNFSSGFSYTIAQGTGGSLTLVNGASAAQINDYNGNHTISAPVVLNSNTTIAVEQAGNVFSISGNISGVGGITLAPTSALNAGTVMLSGSNSYSGGTTVASGTLIIGANGALPSNRAVALSGGKLQLTANTGGETVSSLTITGGSTLDLTNNHIVINYGSPAAQAAVDSTVLGYITSGAIFSSQANGSYGVGWADGNDASESGIVAANSVLVAYALYGDANLDGAVNGNDFTILASNLGKSVIGWDKGDFFNTGAVTGSDFTALVSNLGKSANGADGVLPAADYVAIDAFAAANGLLADVPEPGCVFAAMVSVVVMGQGRTRRLSVVR